MKTLKIAFIDFWPEWADEDFITPILEKHYNLVIDDRNPDVVFHSVFGSKVNQYNCKKVLFLGENKRFHDWKTDYSITFDPHTPTNFRLPLWQVYLMNKPDNLDKLLNGRVDTSHENFCSFTVSNGSNIMRNSMFQQLNNYKKVKSYGRYMTNDNALQTASKGKYWRDAKDDFFEKHTHKFSLTYENNMYPYYTTEKLMDGFLANTVPIYWGDPRINKDWNKKAFINGMRTSNVLNEIKRFDLDDNLYKDMLHEPVFTTEQKERLLENINNFENWLIKII
jgi:hypothetical protein